MSERYNEGMRAYHSDESLEDCPYVEEWQTEEWRQGYNDAQNCSDM